LKAGWKLHASDQLDNHIHHFRDITVSRSGMNALEINELKSIPLYFAFSRWKTGGESFFF